MMANDTVYFFWISIKLVRVLWTLNKYFIKLDYFFCMVWIQLKIYNVIVLLIRDNQISTCNNNYIFS